MCANDERTHANPGSKRENKDKGASFRPMCNHGSGPFAKLQQNLENVLHLFLFLSVEPFGFSYLSFAFDFRRRTLTWLMFDITHWW